MGRFTRDCLLLLLLSSSIKADDKNDTSIGDHRIPRVSGRIVKIYSGNRPEPYMCNSEGYKADPHSCASFYRCVKERSGKFNVYRYQCAPGTVYDPDLETCNHARNTRRTECGGVMKPIPEAMDTNEIEPQKEFPRPINSNNLGFTKETTIQYTSGSPWVTPSVSNSHSTKTTTRQSPSTSVTYFADTTEHNTGYHYNLATNTPWIYSTKGKPDWPKITSLPKLEKKAEICSYDGFTGDVENCRKFYRCVGSQGGGFLRYEFFCSESTVWDEGIQSCNHPWAVKRAKCGRSMAFGEKLTEPSSASEKSTTQDRFSTASYGQKNINTIQEQLQISHGSKVTQTQTQISHSNQVIQNQTQIHYGDRLNQNKNSETKQNQTQISHGSAVSQTQTQFDYGNKGVQTQLQIDHSNDSSQSQIQVESTTSHTTIPKQDSDQNHNNQCSENGFIGDANDCKKFYRCVDSGRGTFTKYEYMCGDGTVWDKSIEACNHAWAVKDCGSQSYPESVDQIHTEPQTSSTMKSTTYYADTTTQNYHTSEYPDIDDIDVGYGNQDQSGTTTASSISSSAPTTTTKKPNYDNTECSSNGFIGDANDCKKFYRCVDNGRGTFTKYEFKCGEGTVWDSDIEACNHAWAVKRCGGTLDNNDKGETTTTSDNIAVQTTVTLIQTTTQLSISVDDYDSGYGSPGTESTSKPILTTKVPQSETTKLPQYDTNNECKSSGFMGDSNNCKKFYRCVDNGSGGFTRHEFTCGEGTVWDPTIEACNHAWAVEKCVGSEAASESNQTTEQTSTVSSVTISTTPIVTTTDQSIHTSTIISSTFTSSTESNENSICIHSGFMGDKRDCKKFYRCVDNGDGTFTRYEFTCGEGTVWDSKIEACNHNWAVESCGDSSGSTKPTITSTSQYPTLQDDDQQNEPSTQSHDSISTTQSTTTSVVNETSTSSQNCNSIGFFGDKNDCKKFYRCVDNGNGGYDQYQFYCGEGTVWDESIIACNHAWAVKECGSSSNNTPQSNNESSSESSISSTVDNGQQETTQYSTEKSTSTTSNASQNEVSDRDCAEEGFFGSVSDCKKFFRCVDNGDGGFKKYEFICGEGTTWNQHIQACDHPSSNRPCNQDYQSTTKGTHINDEIEIETTTKLTLTSLSDKEPQGIQKPQSSSGKCESEGFYGNPSDCKKFYRCVDNGKGGYTKYDFICGDGTVWSQEIQACDHESDDGQCLSSISSTSETSFGPTEENMPQSESTTSSSSTTNINQITDKTESSSLSECSSDGFFAHPHDCKKFVRCVSNGNEEYTKYEFNCGEGTVWVQEIQACDHDNDITNCSNQNELTTKPQDQSQEGSSTTEAGSSWSTENQTPHKENDDYPTTKHPSNEGDDKCMSEGYFANKDDCRKFYRCVDDGNGGYTKYDFICGEETAWDDNIGNCNHINDVASCTETNKEESHTMKEEEVTDVSEGTSTKGTTSSSSSEPTTSSSVSQPTQESESGSNDKCESEGYFGDSKNCKKFYRCVDDGKGGLTKYEFTCGDGTVWDQDITNCNHPQDVTNPSCKSGDEGGEDGAEEDSHTPSTTGSSSTSSPQSSTSSSSSENSSQSSSNCSQEDSSKKPASSKDISCEKAGYYPNPNDCKKFYRCVDWDGDGKRFSVYHFECGEGTIWDPALDTCNHEESVYPPRDCSQTQSPSESSSSGTTTEKQEETTTQESTTSERTTTQEPATSEQTTIQQEKTTTQPSTTSEQTTTQQSTTQQSTTSEQTTTQQSSSSKQTTTQQSTTSEQTTTQQSTTSEQTTQEATTSEQTTTQQSTTSEQTTTQESTTSESTTTQESTASDRSTTQVSQTTTEQTTEQTSEQTESSTTEGTTESSTTEANGGGSTTEQSSTTTESEQQSTTEPSSEKECPDTDDDQNLFVCPTSFKRHPKYCNMFYQCTEDDDTHEMKIATFKCPNETIYDESKTQCVEEKKADKKCDGEMARRHRFKRLHKDSKEPITVDNDKKSCPAIGYYPFEKNIECSNGFLKCERSKLGKLRGYVHQCPEGYLFWTISKRCELLENIRDCKRSSNDWKGRWNIPIDRKNVA